MQPGTQQKILVIEDNESLAEIYKTRLELLNYLVFIAHNGIEGLYFAQNELPDLILLDLMIPDIDGGKVLEIVRKSDWGTNIPVYVISNLNESDAPENLRQLGISGYSVKAMMTDDTVDQIVNGILRKEDGPADAPETSANNPVNYQEIPVAEPPKDSTPPPPPTA